jgi:ribonuclease HII
VLKTSHTHTLLEAGCDEAGRGCLAGPVFAAAVILPGDFTHDVLKDSKQLSEKQRNVLRPVIEKVAISWAVAQVNAETIDEINILNASILAMHLAISRLVVQPQLLLIDGNRFNPYRQIPHQCIIRGDATYLSIAAASILAKTHRDEWMLKLHQQYPVYGWDHNKGYPTQEHRTRVLEHGTSPFHRLTFRMTGR